MPKRRKDRTGETKEKGSRRRLSAYVTNETWRRARIAAIEEGERDFSAFIERVLHDYLDRQQHQERSRKRPS